MDNFLSTREVAEHFAVDEWRIRRLYKLRVLPEPSRLAGKRAIPRADLPAIADALRARGWLPQAAGGRA